MCIHSSHLVSVVGQKIAKAVTYVQQWNNMIIIVIGTLELLEVSNWLPMFTGLHRQHCRLSDCLASSGSSLHLTQCVWFINCHSDSGCSFYQFPVYYKIPREVAIIPWGLFKYIKQSYVGYIINNSRTTGLALWFLCFWICFRTE